jgi:hypothetical protein
VVINAPVVHRSSSEDRSPMPPASRRLGQVLLAVAIAVIIWRLRAFLPPHTLPARGDPALPFQGSDLTPTFAPWLRVSIETLWRQGTLVFWNPFTNAGAPQFEVPEAGVVSLATLLGGVFPLEAAVKWAMLAHVVIGMLGTYVLARRFHVAEVFAGMGAFSFGVGTYLLDHFRVGHLSHIEPLCLAPWAMLLLWQAMKAQKTWWRSAVAAGIVSGFQVLEGGTDVLLYSILAFGLLIVTCLGPEWRRWLGRFVGVGAVAGACFGATAAPQMLPMLTYMGLTGRSGGLTLGQSSAQISEVGHPLPTVAAAVIMCVGLISLVAKRQWRVALWLGAIVALGLGAARVPSIYAFLWEYIPGFRYQRIPERALVLLGIAGPLLIAAGLEGMWRVLSWWRLPGAVLFSMGLVVFAGESWRIAADTPPMADPRVEREENHAMRWLADHAAGSRIHIWESPNRHWGADNITVPLGLESITNYTPSEHRDYLPADFDPPDHRTFMGESYSSPARFWGLLNVRYVLSTVPRAEPGLRLATQVDRCPIEICQPAKSAGPYVYENEEWLPRGWVVRHAIVLVGPSRPVFEAALKILHRSEFDPAGVVILQASPGEKIVPPVDGLFSVGVDAPNALRWESEEAQQILAQLLRQDTPGLQTATFSRPDNNNIEFGAPADGWLVASERIAMYPGWSASIGGKPVNIVRADGVLGAIRVSAGNMVHVSYEPIRFRYGVALLIVMLLAVVGAELRSRRRG